MKISDLGELESHLYGDELVRLKESLSRTTRGSEVDYVSPLIPDRNDPDRGRADRISEIESQLLPTGYRWLDAAEEEQRDKIGAYSVMLPFKERRDQILTYFKQVRPQIEWPAMNKAYRLISGLVDKQSLNPISVEQAFAEMPKNTNLGLPWVTSDGSLRFEVLESAREIETNRYKIDYNYPCMLYWRGQPKGLGEIPKQRTVWGFPHDITVHELRIQEPLLKVLRNHLQFASWIGPDAVNRAVTKIINSTRGKMKLSADFSGYDASVPYELIHLAFNLLRDWFANSEDLIDFLENQFLNIGLATPEGVWSGRSGGVPSGSGLTNLIDSLIQLLVFSYVSIILGNPIVYHLVQGDDGVIVFRDNWDLEQVSAILQELGLNLSTEKGTVEHERIHFLQNIHSHDYRVHGVCVGVRPLYRILNGMLSYERMHNDWSGYDDSVRWMQQLETGKWHPKFPCMIDFLYRNDKYQERYNADQLVTEAGGLKAVESVLRLPSFPYGKADISKINQWVSTRLLNMVRSG